MDIAFGRWPWFGQVGAAGAVCAAGLLVFELTWDVPQREMLVAHRRTLEEKRLVVERARQAARHLPALETAVDELDARLTRLRARLPARRDAAALLRRLETAAALSELTIRAFVPQATAERSWYAEWPIRLELSERTSVWVSSSIASAVSTGLSICRTSPSGRSSPRAGTRRLRRSASP